MLVSVSSVVACAKAYSLFSRDSLELRSFPVAGTGSCPYLYPAAQSSPVSWHYPNQVGLNQRCLQSSNQTKEAGLAHFGV